MPQTTDPMKILPYHQLMRRSSDPEVRRNAAAATTIESLDETAARDAVTVTQDGVQQIVASPASKSMQSSTTSLVDDGSGKEAVELTPLNGGIGGSQTNIKASDSMVSLPKTRVRYLLSKRVHTSLPIRVFVMCFVCCFELFVSTDHSSPFAFVLPRLL